MRHSLFCNSYDLMTLYTMCVGYVSISNMLECALRYVPGVNDGHKT